jgi:hypothetical protein
MIQMLLFSLTIATTACLFVKITGGDGGCGSKSKVLSFHWKGAKKPGNKSNCDAAAAAKKALELEAVVLEKQQQVKIQRMIHDSFSQKSALLLNNVSFTLQMAACEHPEPLKHPV